MGLLGSVTARCSTLRQRGPCRAGLAGQQRAHSEWDTRGTRAVAAEEACSLGRRGAPRRCVAPADRHDRGRTARTARTALEISAAVLVLAFAARAAVALCGDFVLHPDEIMQYLEPAHRLAFGNGVFYWEYFYGARSWLVAGVLKLFDLVGLGQPWWYVGGVKLLFCALSLAVPAAMYWTGRRHFGEAVARVALLAGAFWYELVGLAHKPLTEFVATAPLLALLALCLRPNADGSRVVWQAAGLAVLTAAIRQQYTDSRQCESSTPG